MMTAVSDKSNSSQTFDSGIVPKNHSIERIKIYSTVRDRTGEDSSRSMGFSSQPSIGYPFGSTHRQMMPRSFRNLGNEAGAAGGPTSSQMSYPEYVQGELMLIDGQRYLAESSDTETSNHRLKQIRSTKYSSQKRLGADSMSSV